MSIAGRPDMRCDLNLRGLGMWPHCDLVLSWTISIVLASKKLAIPLLKLLLILLLVVNILGGGSRLVLGMLVRIGT